MNDPKERAVTTGRRWFPVAMTVVAPILWSTGGLAVRAVETPAWTMLFWRALFMFVTVSVITALRALRDARRHPAAAAGGPRLTESVVPIVIAGLCIAGALVLYVMSMTRTSIAASLVVQASGPLFIVMLGWVLLREPVRAITVAAVVVVGVGIAIIVVPSIEMGGIQGNLLGILKAIAFAGAAITIRKFQTVSLIPATVVGAAIATGIAGIAAPSLAISGRDLAILAAMGVFQSGISFSTFATYSRHVESSMTGLIVLLEAVLGPIWVWIVFSEAPNTATLVGGVIVLVALVSHTLLLGRAAPAEAPIAPAAPASR